jgi:hypothetical protein
MAIMSDSQAYDLRYLYYYKENHSILLQTIFNFFLDDDDASE